MKHSIYILVSTLLTFSLFTACETGGSVAEITELSNETDSLSYALGVSIGQNLKQSGFDSLDYAVVAKAMNDATSDADLMISEQESQAVIQQIMMAKQMEQMQAQAEQAGPNKAAGEAFLAENAEKEGVQTTASGLQYLVLKEGTGKSPAATDQVTVHYHGTLIDGTVFDSSVDRGEPTSFALNQVIPGWTEGLQLMKEGAKYRFFIPSELAYGDRAAGDKIKPGSTLIFDVDLISVD